tara:strand:- start:2724 stop:3614 length:891 start_codon:yes stop_codon:yes gene_type:complete
MLPDNFDFAMLPTGSVGNTTFTLEEVGMLASTIENIDYSLVSWVKEDLKLSTMTNEGFKEVPVLWQVPERAYQVKNEKSLRDDNDALVLPLISVERTGIVKNPANRGSFQAHLYSNQHNQRSGRFVIAKRIVEDKTRNFAAAVGTRTNTGASRQRYYPRINKKVVVQFLSVPIPVYVDLEYKIILKTEYQQQMNQLVSPFIARTGQTNVFVMRRNGHLYEGFIDQNFTHRNTVADLAEDARLFETEITVRVLGYLIGEGESDDRPIVKMEENVVEVTFPNEGPVPAGNLNIFDETS